VAPDFLGQGWAFPLAIGPTGGIALSSGERDVEEAVRLILGTAYGERPMRPEYGCGIHDLAFATIDASLTGRVAYEVRASLLRWEPRIEVRQVDAQADPEEPGVLLIHVGYVLRATNDRRNLVFPFYTIPEHG
jgi:phage baseplate assembly protein W